MNAHAFPPPPKTMTLKKLQQVASRYSPNDLRSNAAMPYVAAAVHESAHALANILFGREAVVVSLRDKGAARTWCYPPSVTNHGEVFQDAVISWAGLTAEQVLTGCSDGFDIPDAALGDHECAVAESEEYAQHYKHDTGEEGTIAEFSDKALVLSRDVARALVYRYWNLIERMAYVSLRDSGNFGCWWTGDRLDWVLDEVAAIDSGKPRYSSAFELGPWLKEAGRKRRNQQDLLDTRRLIASIQRAQARRVGSSLTPTH